MLIAGMIIYLIGIVVAIVIIDKYPLFWAGLIVASFAFILIFIGADNGSYKEGQIDALNGVVKYKLQEQEDNTTVWVEIEDE